VGAFIEECYRKRFGGVPEFDKIRHPKGESRSDTDEVFETAVKPFNQIQSLVCYLANLSEDLERWLVHGAIAPEVLAQVREELLEIADALKAGTPIPEIPDIPFPPEPRSARPARGDRSEHELEDNDEISF